MRLKQAAVRAARAREAAFMPLVGFDFTRPLLADLLAMPIRGRDAMIDADVVHTNNRVQINYNPEPRRGDLSRAR
jgi:hypothetical protein